MKILALDYGEAKVGLSVSEGQLAQPLKVEPKTKDFFKKIKDFCQKEGIEKIVVGLSEGKMAQKQKAFGVKVGKVCYLPVEFWDETLTSQEALSQMIKLGLKRKSRRREDAFAAALILESYLESQRKATPHG